jgi:phosphoribosylformimino-5-aminoimidazole carboxamide ribotide isomerase
MELFPAIDIRGGRVVRVRRSGSEPEVTYGADPLAQAVAWQEEGARWLHVVDLDRAFGTGEQSRLLGAIVKRVSIPVQVGGGLADADAVAQMRDLGVQRVVLGPGAAADPRRLGELAARFTGVSLALALDVRDGRCAARGWPTAAAYTPLDLARRAREAGISLMVHTDLSREGALGGPNVAAAATLAQSAAVDVIVSGGVGSLDDLRRVRDAGLAGVVVGRALLEGRFTLREALG